MASKELQSYNRVYVWELPVRLWHWAHVGSMVVLGITGYYIGNPFIASGASPSDPSAAGSALGIMAAARMTHFMAAIVLTACILLRFYWFFAGNRYSKLLTWLPFSSRKSSANSLRLMREQIKYYLFMRRDAPHGAGHNPVAALSYFVALLLLVVMTVTGWALYALGSTTGIFWKLFSWVLDVWSLQTIRSVHHITMYLLIMFFFLHLYLAIRDDVLSDSGTMSSMINGYKYWPKGHKKS